jgi:hypothetical protein
MATRQLKTTIGIVVGGLAVALTLAACSGGSKTAASSSSTPAVSPTVSAPPGSATAGSSSGPGAADFTQYTACLSAHGVAIPSFSGRPRGSGVPRPSGSFSRPPGSRGPGDFGGFGGPDASANPSASAALAACASLRPSGGFGGRLGNGVSAATFAAFKSCMSDQGVTITATDAQEAIRALDRNDPKTVAALKVCQPILGQIARSPVASASPSG